MYTIKQASQLTGVPEASLRAWERRYGVVVPARNESGYRVYDQAALAPSRPCAGSWTTAGPGGGCRAVRSGTVPAELDEAAGPVISDGLHPANAVTYMQRFLSAAAQLDTAALEESLDGGFALGSFEHVSTRGSSPPSRHSVRGGRTARSTSRESTPPATRSIGGSRRRSMRPAAGPEVRRSWSGLPAGSQHELGALAFATAIRRRGMDVLYLGPTSR